MKKPLLLTTIMASLYAIGYGQNNMLSPQKVKNLTGGNSNTEVRGGPSGETCASAITVMLGNNSANGPSSGGGCYNCTDATNADWYVYTATSAGTASISTCLQGADTRVWIYETSAGCGELDLIAANDDFCELAAGDDPYASYVEFSVCAGKTYYFEFDDRWEDGPFVFEFAFTAVAGAELAITDGTFMPYTRVPRSAGVVSPNVTIKNLGSVPLTTVGANLTLTKNGSPFSTNTENVSASLATCSEDNYTSTALAQENGNYVATLNFTAVESETNTANNSITASFIVDTVYARDNGVAVSTFGIGTSGVLGQIFNLPKPDKITSVSIKLAEAVVAGSTMKIEVYAANSSGQPTGAALGSTATINVTDADTAGWKTLSLTSPVNLPAGNFFIGFVEVGEDLTLPVGITDEIVTPNTTWANVPGITTGFESLDDAGFGGFQFLLRANFGQTYSWASVDETTGVTDFKLMPNPTTGLVTVVFTNNSPDTRISVLDATGKLVKDEFLYNNSTVNHTVDLSHFANGVYTIRVVSGNDIINRKVILAK